ncbi:MAG TPA: hypothetical protein VGR51_08195 [Thermoplasmata archaeon]|nr:hypothetical protein [Thermoplasmata archaeon]
MAARVLPALLKGDGALGWRSVHPYKKWQGAFWRLVSLLELGADSEPALHEMLDVVLDWLTADDRRARVRRVTINGRARWCATQDGLGLWAASRLGRASDPRARYLAEHLVEWQWPDGGWNCDIRPEANHSSFNETHGALRGLAAYDEAVGAASARRAAVRAADFFLEHRLFRSHRDGRIVHPEIVEIHWPPYWHYDYLVGLRAVAAVKGLRMPEAADAIDVLRKARRPDGTWGPGGHRYWNGPGSPGSNVEVVDWADVAESILTDQATDVLRRAGRDPAEESRSTATSS